MSIVKVLLKSESLDIAVEEFSLAYSSWYMSHDIMLYKYGKRTRNFFGTFLFYFTLVFYILGSCFIKQFFHSRFWDMRLLIALRARWLSGVSYPTCVHIIIVNSTSIIFKRRKRNKWNLLYNLETSAGESVCKNTARSLKEP